MKLHLQILLLTFVMRRTIICSSKDNLRYLSETHFQFAIELYNEVAKSQSGNLVIAGHSANVGMAMLFLGTTAKTTSSFEIRIWIILVLFKLYLFMRMFAYLFIVIKLNHNICP